MAKAKKSKIKRRIKWGLLKFVIKLVFTGGTAAGGIAAAKKVQAALGGLTRR